MGSSNNFFDGGGASPEDFQTVLQGDTFPSPFRLADGTVFFRTDENKYYRFNRVTNNWSELAADEILDTGNFSVDGHTHTLADVTDAGTAAAQDVSAFASASHVHTLSDVADAGTAASASIADFATAAQGIKADTAVQPGDDAVTLGSDSAASGGYALTADGLGGTSWSLIESGVTSVNAATGDVTLTTDDVNEGATNKYYDSALANADIDARVDKGFVDALGVDAATLDGFGTTSFATAVQGGKADTALQPGDLNDQISRREVYNISSSGGNQYFRLGYSDTRNLGMKITVLRATDQGSIQPSTKEVHVAARDSLLNAMLIQYGDRVGGNDVIPILYEDSSIGSYGRVHLIVLADDYANAKIIVEYSSGGFVRDTSGISSLSSLGSQRYVADVPDFWVDENANVILEENLFLQNNYLIYHNTSGINESGNNIDHIWSDDGQNEFNFVHDGSIRRDGNSRLRAGSFSSSSDRKLKKNIEDAKYGLAEVLQLQPRAFQMIDDRFERQHIGFVAQEVLDIVPEAVAVPETPKHVNRDGEEILDEDGEPYEHTLGVYYGAFAPVLTKAIQELSGIVDEQTQTIKRLEERIAALEGNSE